MFYYPQKYLWALYASAVVLSSVLILANNSFAASLRQNVLIKDDVVRLSDIFDDAGRHANRVVMQAPKPGRKVTLNVQWLYHAARSYEVEWTPLSRLDQSVIERYTTTISTEQIRDTIATGIRSKLEILDQFEIELDNRLIQMELPGEAASVIKIKRIQLDQKTRRFSAVLVGKDGRKQAGRLVTTGRYHRLVNVPVLMRRMRDNEIINQNDIRLITLRSGKLDINALQDTQDVIGMSPIRAIPPGRPIRRNEVRTPVVISKGSIVTMVFQTNKMMLTAQGKAMQDGSKDDTIRILNSKTRRTIDAIVVNSSTVIVKPLGKMALK